MVLVLVVVVMLVAVVMVVAGGQAGGRVVGRPFGWGVSRVGRAWVSRLWTAASACSRALAADVEARIIATSDAHCAAAASISACRRPVWTTVA